MKQLFSISKFRFQLKIATFLRLSFAIVQPCVWDISTTQYEHSTINQLHDSFRRKEKVVESNEKWKKARHIGIYNVSYAIWKWVFFLLPQSWLLRPIQRAIEYATKQDCHLKRVKKTFSVNFLCFFFFWYLSFRSKCNWSPSTGLVGH